MRILKGAGRFVLFVLVLALFFWFAWTGSWLTFGRIWGLGALGVTLIPAVPLALVAVTIYWLSTRGQTRLLDPFVRQSVLTSLGLYLLLCGTHFVRKPPMRFEFLQGQPMAFPHEPAWPAYLGATYTFAASPKAVMDRAEVELRSMGFRVDRTSTSFNAYREQGETFGPIVDISVGKATGKSFHIDGDMVTLANRNDWVTVSIEEPDAVPLWIRMWLP